MNTLIGLLLVTLAGTLNGSFALPMKGILRWEWENTWLAYAFVGMIVLPGLITILYVPQIPNIYAEVEGMVLLKTGLFGLGWGTGSVMFGLALYLLGFSLGYTIVIGGISTFGALIPYLITDAAHRTTEKSLILISALILSIVGIALCAYAGRIKMRGEDNGRPADFRLGLVVAIFAGLLSSMLNFAFHFGSPITEAAYRHLGGSASDFLVNHPVWFIALGAGFVPFLIYCTYLFIRNGSLRLYARAHRGKNWLFAFLMAVLWLSCIIVYGIGANRIGALGTSLGWIILMSLTVVVGNLWGFVTGEWKQAPGKAVRLMLLGIILLLFSVTAAALSGS
jgi:L-rhamnose-H+ transport protein